MQGSVQREVVMVLLHRDAAATVGMRGTQEITSTSALREHLANSI